jgi:hypothetical protein
MLGGGGHALGGGGVAGAEAGVRFTCFTGTTVQIRTRRGGGARVCVYARVCVSRIVFVLFFVLVKRVK